MSSTAFGWLGAPSLSLDDTEEICPPTARTQRLQRDDSQLSPNGRAALSYARLGWRVLPILPGTDVLAMRALRGVRDATTNDAAITRWWTTYPSASIAVATGRDSDLWVLEIDRRRPSAATPPFSELPQTVEASLAGERRFLFFRFVPELGLATWGPVALGVTPHGPGSTVLVPASQATDDQPLTWAAGRAPWECPIAYAPMALIQSIARMPR